MTVELFDAPVFLLTPEELDFKGLTQFPNVTKMIRDAWKAKIKSEDGKAIWK